MERLAEAEQALTLAKSCDIDLPVTLRISRIEGNYTRSPRVGRPFPNARSHQSHSSPLPDLYVAVQLWAENRPLTLPFYTPHKNFSTSFTWATPITLPIKYRDLPHSSQLAFTILDVTLPDAATRTCPNPTSAESSPSPDHTITDSFLLSHSTVVGGTTLALFGKKRTLRKGKQRCFIHRNQIADGNVSSTTPSKIAILSEPDPNSLETFEEGDKLGRLEKLVKKHERGDLPRLEWLDQLAFRKIERIHAQETAKSRDMYLYVDLPRFDFPILFNEIELPSPCLPSALSAVVHPTGSNTSAIYSPHHLADIFTVVDPDMVHDNPIENKHTRLHRSHRNGPLDRELRPEKSVRDSLNNILSYPPTRALTRNERDLVWRFRFYLSHDKRALTKFLKSVVWSDKGEVSQAIGTLLPIWSEISLDDALELLGPSEDYREPRVKKFAVQQLARADDDELVLYLLQLVQALKFDLSPSVGFESQKTSPLSTSPSAIAQSQRFPAGPSQRVNVGSSSTVLGGRENRLSFTPSAIDTSTRRDSQIKPLSLEDFLIERSCSNPTVLGYQFYWYLTVEASADGDKSIQVMYGRVLQKFYDKMRETERGRSMAETIQRQKTFVTFLSKLAKEIRTSKDGRPKKIEKLKQVLKDPVKLGQLFSVESPGQIVGLPLPLDSSKMIVGVDTESSTVFKSNLFPLRLALRCSDGTEYPVIFKDGDDLRQDQLVIQLISLMDRLLRKENLDLRLTPYKVLATGQTVGLVQFIPSKTLGEVAAVYPGGILEYLRTENPDSGGSLGHYGVLPSVLESFVRSCAGYCVVTYILGVGDRHLDNLMVSPGGQFFHVDFGYILGRDPKPFPPSIKVCKEMVDGMGGDKSLHYGRFKRLCYTAFICLRKNAGLIINLVGLMVDANIPDIKLEPDKAVMKVQEKFRLDLSEEEAIKHFENELNDTSYFTLVFDKIHAVAQYWRA
ncbi:hypothetical protein PCANC_17341 [Puccinia coronata f. sp. avenae]|uniref:Phosphatidylinositol 3-kinase VPS34 n=2 Tax=Puccinia coronata f. sp. avenae TaxID=200324 RepID=A0A2N5UUA7_9BASI|nr:hypothetical protein PCANC_17341 [Puccinia coronata f. sp. avenae]